MAGRNALSRLAPGFRGAPDKCPIHPFPLAWRAALRTFGRAGHGTFRAQQNPAANPADVFTLAGSPDATGATQSQRWRAVAAASLGNALEWFDFVIYGYFAATIAKLFFPSNSDLESLLIALATFGITFFIRPLGAILLGAFADRHGRKSAFMLTICLMMFGTAIIAVVPTYAVIGPLAPIAIVVARFIQGISAGGGFGSATAFLAEQDPARRGFFASWQFASQGLTTVIAAACGAILTGVLSTEQIDAWGWRVPFVFGLSDRPGRLLSRAPRRRDQRVQVADAERESARSPRWPAPRCAC